MFLNPQSLLNRTILYQPRALRSVTTMSVSQSTVGASAPAANGPVHGEDGINLAYPITIMPYRQTKTIHFIRHGQGFHNVAGQANHESYKSEEWCVVLQVVGRRAIFLIHLLWTCRYHRVCMMMNHHGCSLGRMMSTHGTLTCRFDAHLTEEGWRQAEDLNRHIVASGLSVELVVVSPLARALETAVGAFGRRVEKMLYHGGGIYHSDDDEMQWNSTLLLH